MRLALVNPRKVDKRVASESPPLNLGFLAGYVKQERPGVDVALIDGLAGQDIRREIARFNPDIVGITSTTPTVDDAYDVAEWCRERGIYVVMGGVHPTCMPEEAIQHCDCVVVGEGETALLEVIDSKPKGIIERPILKNIDEVPRPTWELFDMPFYFKTEEGITRVIGGTKGLTIITSRGCCWRCSFCHNSWRRNPVRYNSARRVVEDIEFLIKNYGIDTLFFVDDEFIVFRKRFEEIASLLKEKKIKLLWGCQARADIIIRYGGDYLKLMKDAGCRLVAIGCESGNQRILNMLKCDTTTVEQNTQAINMVKEAGMKASGSFMVGVPTETKKEMLDTFNYIMNSNLDSGGIGIATPYPRTTLWNMCKEMNLIPEGSDYSRYKPNEDVSKALIVCNTMPKEEFIKLYKDWYQRVGEKMLTVKVERSGFPVLKTFFTVLRFQPVYALTYPFKHPIRTIKLLIGGRK